jgi:hypothetical protein
MSIRQEDRGLTLRLFATCDEALACFGASTAIPYACGWLVRTVHYRWADASGALPADWDPSPSLLGSAAAAARPARGTPAPELNEGADMPPAMPLLGADTGPSPTAIPCPPGTNTPIEVLLREYEAENCDHSDLEWVSRTALHYVARMPDGQVRCLLHVLATHVHQSAQPKPPLPCNPAETAEPPKGE